MNTLLIIAMGLISCLQKPEQKINMTDTINNPVSATGNQVLTDTATLANGCFWCTEAIFEQLEGVISATSGYTDGHVVNPTYKEVCTGETGHAECLQVVYDPKKITFDELLEVF